MFEGNWQLVTEIVVLGLLIAIPAVFAYRRNSAGALSMMVACGFAFLLLKSENVKSLALGPLKAEMQSKIAEANATIEQLRGLALSLSRATLENVGAMGRLGGPGFKLRYKERDMVVKQLRDLGVTQAQIDGATADFDNWVALDLSFLVRYAAEPEIAVDSPEARGTSACLDALIDRREAQIAPTSEYRKCFGENIPLSTATQEALADLEFFQQTRTLRRPAYHFGTE